MTRLAALGERIDTPLLVTNLVNVRYLVGFESSNAALLVQPGGETTLYTDFRYDEAAKSIADVEVVMTKRVAARRRRVAAVRPGAVREQRGLARAGGRSCRPARPSSCRSTGVVEGLRAVKSEDEIAKIKKAAQIADRAFEALTAEIVRRSHGARGCLAAARADACARLGCAVVRLDRRVRARTARCRTDGRPDKIIGDGASSSPSTGAAASRATTATRRARSRRAASRTGCARSTTCACAPRSRHAKGCAPE